LSKAVVLQLAKKTKVELLSGFIAQKELSSGFIAQKVYVCRLLLTDSHLLRGERARPPLYPKLVGNRSKFTPNNKKFVKKLVLLCFQNKTPVQFSTHF